MHSNESSSAGSAAHDCAVVDVVVDGGQIALGQADASSRKRRSRGLSCASSTPLSKSNAHTIAHTAYVQQARGAPTPKIINDSFCVLSKSRASTVDESRLIDNDRYETLGIRPVVVVIIVVEPDVDTEVVVVVVVVADVFCAATRLFERLVAALAK